MFLKNPTFRPTLIAVVLALSGCAGLPSAPAVTADSPLVDVVLPDSVLGKSNKNDPVLKKYSKANALKESEDLRTICAPGGLSRFGGSFIDSSATQVFNATMARGSDVVKQRNEWIYETTKLKKQSELLNAFLKGRGGAYLTPEKFDLLSRENAAYQQWTAKVAEARQNAKDGNLSPDQQRRLQQEFPKFRMGRTEMHSVVAAVDGVNYNSKVLQEKDKHLQEDVQQYRENLSAVYKSALQKQMAMTPNTVSLDQIVNFDVFRSYSVMACLSRVGSSGTEDANFSAIESAYQKYARQVVLPKLPEIYKDLATAKSSEALQLGLANRFPTPNLAAIALDDPEFSKKTSSLKLALRQKEEAALAERRRQESEAVAAVERQKRDAFRSKAARGVVPSKDEFLKVFVDAVFANTQERLSNFAYKFVRSDDVSFTTFTLSLKTSETSFHIDNLNCSPASGKLMCSWTTKITFTDFDLFRDEIYYRTHQEKATFAWTDYGLKCQSDCGWYISRGTSGGGSARAGSYGNGTSRDSDDYNREASERYNEQQEANRERERKAYNDNYERIQNSNGRCRSASICP